MRLAPVFALGLALVVLRSLDLAAFFGVPVERVVVSAVFISFIVLALVTAGSMSRTFDGAGGERWRLAGVFLALLLLSVVVGGGVALGRSRGVFAQIGSGFGPFTVWPSLSMSFDPLSLVGYMTLGRIVHLMAVSFLLAVVVLEVLTQRREKPLQSGRLGAGLGAGSLGVTACPACGVVPLLMGAFSAAGPSMVWDPSTPLAAFFDVASVLGPLGVLAALRPEPLGRRSSFRSVVLFSALVTPTAFAVLGMPEGASERQGGIHDLYVLATIAALFLVVVTVSLLIGFAIRYRARDEDPKDHTLSSGARRTVQTLYIAVPILVIFGVGAVSFAVLMEFEEVPDDAAHHVDVMATQFAWRFTYPDGTSTLNELRVRAGEPVVLNVTSDDVIHSLFIPDMGVKLDATPGTVSTTWFQAHREGTYSAYCVEYCGVGHAGMLANLVVHPEDAPRPSGDTGRGAP